MWTIFYVASVSIPMLNKMDDEVKNEVMSIINNNNGKNAIMSTTKIKGKIEFFNSKCIVKCITIPL